MLAFGFLNVNTLPDNTDSNSQLLGDVSTNQLHRSHQLITKKLVVSIHQISGRRKLISNCMECGFHALPIQSDSCGSVFNCLLNINTPASLINANDNLTLPTLQPKLNIMVCECLCIQICSSAFLPINAIRLQIIFHCKVDCIR